MKVLVNGVNVRVILIRRNKDFGWLAAQINVKPKYIRHVIAGRKGLSPERRELLRKALGNRPWDELFRIVVDQTGTAA